MSNQKGAIIEFTAYRVVFPATFYHPGFTGVKFGKGKATVYGVENFTVKDVAIMDLLTNPMSNEQINVRGQVVSASMMTIGVELIESKSHVSVWHDGNYEGIKFIDDEQ